MGTGLIAARPGSGGLQRQLLGKERSSRTNQAEAFQLWPLLKGEEIAKACK